MCGISVIISKSSDREDQLIKSLSKIIHRGNSNFEYKVLEGAVMGTNRLPIVGRLTGQQPVYNEDETIFAVLNGEIFNYKEITTELKVKGHVFRGDSDTEVLVHLYEEYGDKMVESLDSEMYAFVVFDTKTGDFYAARDRFGVKPFYYAIDARDNSYHFSSELKQLVQFDFITEAFDFPSGHYMKNGKLSPYYEMTVSNEIMDEKEVVRNLTSLMVDAVKKRVDTDLPVAVLLSGGIDSSLVMEIANRYHSNVTAYILGRPGASDYEAALRLCKDFKYRYKIVFPDVDYAAEIEKVIYHMEIYEAQVLRQAFAQDIISRAIVRDGFRIAIVGDASDEIFGGYNEFIRLSNNDINKGCELITKSLSRSHNIRLDRMTMKHTLEARVPFLDTKVVDYAMRINGSLKINRKEHDVTTKYIIRQVATKFLPDYIAYRYKVPFSNGAGMNVGFNFRTQDGDVAKAVLESDFGKLIITEGEKKKMGFITKEEEIYYAMYKSFSYDKLADHKERIITKETLSQIDSDKNRLRVVVAEFDRMPIYFPVYLAEKLSLFSKYDLDISFVSTGGDDLTYNSLFSGSAQIGISDPIFSFSNGFATKGKIFGSLIDQVPVVAITIDPSIKIESKDDFKKYKIGSFQEFSTVNTIARYYLPGIEIKPIRYNEIINALKHREIDIAFVSLDYAFILKGVGGRILHSLTEDFKEHLFTGLTISDNLDPSFIPAIDKFKVAIKEAIVSIYNFPEESKKILEELFPDIIDSAEFLSSMKKLWHKKLDDIDNKEVLNAEKIWKKIHPELLKATSPNFIKLDEASKIILSLTNYKTSRQIPYREDRMSFLIEESLAAKKPLEVISFWGASDKKFLSETDYLVLDKIKEFCSKLKTENNIDTKIIFILADNHGMMNAYSSSNYSVYLKNIQIEMKKRNFESIYLSSVWKKGGLTEKKIRERVKTMSAEEWSGVRISNDLEKMAMHRGHKDEIEGAKAYYVTRKLENPLIEEMFANAIQISLSDDKFQEVYPELPALYLWPYKQGRVDKLPWFDYVVEKTKSNFSVLKKLFNK
jgi:asparagine synthase (glutamine-hydrolysing)